MINLSVLIIKMCDFNLLFLMFSSESVLQLMWIHSLSKIMVINKNVSDFVCTKRQV